MEPCNICSSVLPASLLLCFGMHEYVMSSSYDAGCDVMVLYRIASAQSYGNVEMKMPRDFFCLHSRLEFSTTRTRTECSLRGSNCYTSKYWYSHTHISRLSTISEINHETTLDFTVCLGYIQKLPYVNVTVLLAVVSIH